MNNLETGTLRKGDKYLRTSASLPVRQVKMRVDQLPFNRLMKSMRYESRASAEREHALDSLSQIAT
jgi:hypothetical protein